MTIRVAVVDDHPLSRHRMIGILKATKDIEIVGEGFDSADAVDLVERFLPDVLIMDLSNSKMTDLEAIRRIHVLSPPLKILILSVREEKKFLFNAFAQGAQGYIIKMVDPDELVHAVHRVHVGEAVVPGDLALRILSDRLYRKRFPVGEGFVEPLTVREEEVLRELGTGATNKDIAQRLSIGEHTVRIHVRNILNKLHMSNRVEAATFAMKEGLVKE
ncbi:MAG: response regulator [Bacilli bacterium]